jgi:BASS family bile acid:Na+ symporter
MLTRLVNFFWLWTLVGTLWAWFYPIHFTWFLGKLPGTEIGLVSLGLGIIMLGMGVTLTVGDFREVSKNPRYLFVGVSAQFVLMPLIGWVIASLFSLPDQFKLGLILVSCCPGGTASNVVTYLAKGNLALSVLITMCSTFVAVGATPLLTKIYASAILEIDALAMLQSMVTIVLLPIIGGLVLNHYFGQRMSFLKKISPMISVFVIVLIVGAIVGATKLEIIKHWKTLLPAVFLLHAVGFTLGHLWARVFQMGRAECRTISIEVGMQNSGLGSQLAKTHFTLLAATPCAISAFFHCMIGSVLASFWSKQDSGGSQ